MLGEEKEMEKVPVNDDNMMKCICEQCPVQAKSACSRPKIEKMMEMIASMSKPKEGTQSSDMSASIVGGPMSEIKPKPEEMPVLFCSIGIAACTDLDINKACICRACQVYKDYSLKQGRPVEHYCLNGKAV